MTDIRVGQTRICNRLLHGDVVISRAVTHEAAQLAVDMFIEIHIRRAVDMGSKAHFLVDVAVDDARLACPQALGHFGGVGSDGGDDAETCHGDPAQAIAAHGFYFSLGGNRPTRRPAVV